MPSICRTSVWCDIGSAMLKNIKRIVESMLDSNNTDDKQHSHAKDNYYAGYYFSNTPYSSEDSLPGRKTDEELRSLVAEKLKSISHIDTSKVVINVVDQVVSITGSVQTYENKRRIGEEIWKIEGVVKVLNELHVTEPPTAGPTRRD
ncbi:MAG: BON domain-containing protein [Nitrososphaeraceae archaeon]